MEHGGCLVERDMLLNTYLVAQMEALNKLGSPTQDPH